MAQVIKIAKTAQGLWPIHEHDCGDDVYLGQIGLCRSASHGNQDVWLHEANRTLIMRYGVGSDYATVNLEYATSYSAEHPAHDAIALLQNYELEAD